MPRRGVDLDAWVPLGIVGRPRGLAGAAWLYPYNVATETLRTGLTVKLVPVAGAARTATITALEDGGRALVVCFEGVNTRDEVNVLNRATVEVQRRVLPPLSPGEYYHTDLPGLSVRGPTGETLGVVVRVEAYPTVDALVIRTPDGESEVLVTEDTVTEVNVAAGTVTLAHGALNAP